MTKIIFESWQEFYENVDYSKIKPTDYIIIRQENEEDVWLGYLGENWFCVLHDWTPTEIDLERRRLKK